MKRSSMILFLALALAGCDSDKSSPAAPAAPVPVTGPYNYVSAFDLAATLADGVCVGTGRIATGGFECQQLVGGTLQGVRSYIGPVWIQASEPSRTWWANGPAGWYSYSDLAAPALVSGNTLALGNAATDAFTTQATIERIDIAGRDIRQVLADFGISTDFNLTLTLSASDVPVPAGALFPAGAFAYRLQRHDEPAGATLPVIAGDSLAVSLAAGGTPADLDALLAGFGTGNTAGDWLGYDTIYTAVGGPGHMAPWGEYEVQFRSDGTAAARLRWLDGQPVQALPDLSWTRVTVAGIELLKLELADASERDSMRWLRGIDAPWYVASPGGKYWMVRDGQVYRAIVSPPRADRTLYALNPVAADAAMPHFRYP